MTEVQKATKDHLRPHGPVTRISDDSECDRLLAQASRMTSSVERLSPLMLRQLEWVAVPVGDVVSRETEARILAIARQRGINTMSIVCTGPVIFSGEPYPQDYVYELDLTDAEATDFFMPPSHPFLYFPKTHERYPNPNAFALIFGDEGEYYAIAGLRDFVEEALGKSVEEARTDFQKWIDQEESDKIKKYLNDIADQYTSLDS